MELQSNALNCKIYHNEAVSVDCFCSVRKVLIYHLITSCFVNATARSANHRVSEIKLFFYHSDNFLLPKMGKIRNMSFRLILCLYDYYSIVFLEQSLS